MARTLFLPASIVIKECPCRNGGECLPDYRYFDGRGNFTFLCPEEYTGMRCELDVDECKDEPCLNGNCTNQQPGISCSCIAGYTGNLCETQVINSPYIYKVCCTQKRPRFQDDEISVNCANGKVSINWKLNKYYINASLEKKILINSLIIFILFDLRSTIVHLTRVFVTSHVQIW